MPLAELSSSQDCLENWMQEMTAGTLAKGDPKRVFLRVLAASRPNVDAVDLYVTRIHAANTCENFLRVRRVFDSDIQVTDQSALVTAEIEMVVLAPFSVQPRCIELHRHMLGQKHGQAGSGAAEQQGQLWGDATPPDREILHLSEGREWPLAL